MKRFAVITASVALLAGLVAMPGSGASFNDSDPCPASGPLLVCPTMQVGQPVTLQLLGKHGCELFRWVIANGNLPSGLTMSSSGLVTGRPTRVESTEPWMEIHDLLPSEGGHSWCIGDVQSERQFVFRVVAGLSIQDEGVPGGTVGQAYTKTLTALAITSINPVQGTPATATWEKASGTLPPGMTLSSAGVLSGTPTAEGSHTFVVRASGGGGVVDTETYTIVVRQPVVLTVPPTAAKAEVGVPFATAPTASGGEGTFTWSVSKGALPAGLALAADGSISGTPGVPGRYRFTLTVTDRESRSKSVDVTMVVAPKLAFKTLTLRPATVGRAYRARVATLGGVRPLTWTIRGKLPRGIAFSKTTGTFSGTPKTAGKFRVALQVVDALGVSAKKTLTLVVGGASTRR